MEPAPVGRETSIQPACFRNVPWVDCALVVTAVVLGIIALLVHLEVINPALNLPTLSPHLLIKSICTASAGILLGAEIGKLIYDRCSTTQATTLPIQSSPAIHPQISSKEIEQIELNVQFGLYYVKPPEVEITACPIKTDFTFFTTAGRQTATLYAILPASFNPTITIKELTDELKVVSTPGEALQKLNALRKNAKYERIDLALRMDDSLIVAANQLTLFDGTIGSVMENVIEIYKIEEATTNTKMLMLVGPSMPVSSPLKKIKGKSFTECTMELFTDFKNKNVSEICMITLNLRKSKRETKKEN